MIALQGDTLGTLSLTTLPKDYSFGNLIECAGNARPIFDGVLVARRQLHGELRVTGITQVSDALL